MIVFIKSIKRKHIYSILLTVALHVTELHLLTISKLPIDYCENTQFQCDNGQCIHESFACDGISDCDDSSDETYKHCQNKTCDENFFQCDYGACINKEYHCDGLNQCNDGSDELSQKCNAIHRENTRSKRDTGNMCAAPLPSDDKTITYKCGAEDELQSCDANGFVPESTIATIKCNSDYHFIKNTNTYHRSVCIDKTWTPPINECVIGKCEEAIPVNFDLRCSRKGINIPCDNSTILPGTKVRISPSCKILQEYSDNAGRYPEITCQSNGTWDKPLLLCAPEEDTCKQYDSQICVKVQDCPMAKTIIANMKAVFCGLDNQGAGRMCCPLQRASSQNDSSSLMYLSFAQKSNVNNRSKDSAAIARSYCEKYSSSYYQTGCVNEEPPIGKRIPTLPNEHPHMAILGIGRNLQEFQGCCVGALISETFIVSEAGCCAQFRKGEIKWAVLGNVNRSSIGADVINGMTSSYSVVKIYNHPNFKIQTYHDNIALYQLNTSVVMHSDIRPACLPALDQQWSYGTKFRATGFGQTNFLGSISHISQKSTVTAIDEQQCAVTVYNWDFDSNSVICTGDKSDGEAFCVFSAGSPLQRRIHNNQSCIWTIFGLYSFTFAGYNISCTANERSTPLIHTRISHYVDWIQSIVWP